MKSRSVFAAAAVLGLSLLVTAAASEPSQAQSEGYWQPAGSYATQRGGEVWMINSATGQARNCFWNEGSTAILCSQSY